jgi:hypothetical protein
MDGVAILGGFAGYGTANPDARDVTAYPSILSGDIGVAGDNLDNSYSVVTDVSTSPTADLDGFTITGGYGGTSGYGAGMSIRAGSPTVNDCTFTGNEASTAGGGMENGGSPTVTNCTFSGNVALVASGEYGGGGMANMGGSPTVTNCVFTGNSAVSAPGSNSLADGGGMWNLFASPTLTNCTFTNNTARVGGGMRDFNVASPILTNCKFIGNSATLAGGGIGESVGNVTTLLDCTFNGNIAPYGGAALLGSGNNSSATLSNCTFSENASDPTTVGGNSGYGGALYAGSAVVNLVNCTFSGNTAKIGGAAVYNGSAALTMANCILWGDTSPNGSEFYNSANRTPAVTYNDIQGGYAGAGNINANPLFLLNPSPGNSGDLHIPAYSPAVDAGNNAAVPAGITADKDGDNRFQDVPTSAHSGIGPGPIVDMGAYEAAPALAAGAGGPYAVLPGQSITLQGYGSSNFAGPLTYSWDLNDDGIFGDSSLPNPVFSTAGYAPGTLTTVALKITDSMSNSVVGTATVTILPLVLYVDPHAQGTGNGWTWANAFTTLAAALNAAVAGQAIDVAQGIYPPTSGTDPTATFQLRDDIAIYGGYAGDTAPIPGVRNVIAYPTILSGDIPTAGRNANNIYHIVTGSGTDSTAVLDGVTINGGYARGSGNDRDGAGILDIAGSPTINDCTISGNIAGNDGGGMFNGSYSSPTLTNCTFTGNSAETYGGGMSNESNSSPTLINCVFIANSSSYQGGGMSDLTYSSATLVHCTFSGDAAQSGDEIVNASSAAKLTDCLIDGDGEREGSTIINEAYYATASITINDCTITGDSAEAGSGLYNYSGDNGTASATITNSTVWGDGPDEIGTFGPVTATYSDIQGGYIGTGNINADPQFVNGTAGNFALKPTSPCVNIGDNAATISTGVTTDLAGNPRIVDGVVDMGAYEIQSPAILWTGMGDGVNWSNANNWSDKLIPTQNDAITIPAGVAVVQVGGGAFSVSSITSFSPMEILSTGSLKLFGSSTLNSPLTIDNGGILDIQGNSLTINYAAGADPAATIRGYLRSAYAGGIWTGAGLTSSTVASQIESAIKNPGGGVYAIGYLDGSADLAQTIAVGDQLVIEPTISGDTDLNGDTNFLDLGRTAQNLGSSRGDWYHGDFNYDGAVNFLDIGLLAQNLNKTTLNTPLAAEISVPVSSILGPAQQTLPNPNDNSDGGEAIVSVWTPPSNSTDILFSDTNLMDVLA